MPNEVMIQYRHRFLSVLCELRNNRHQYESHPTHTHKMNADLSKTLRTCPVSGSMRSKNARTVASTNSLHLGGGEKNKQTKKQIITQNGVEINKNKNYMRHRSIKQRSYVKHYAYCDTLLSVTWLQPKLLTHTGQIQFYSIALGCEL